MASGAILAVWATVRTAPAAQLLEQGSVGVIDLIEKMSAIILLRWRVDLYLIEISPRKFSIV